MLKISSLQRNDVPGAVALYRERAAAGTLTPAIESILFELQDDPAELRLRLDKLPVGPSAFNPVPYRARGTDLDLSPDDLDALAPRRNDAEPADDLTDSERDDLDDLQVEYDIEDEPELDEDINENDEREDSADDWREDGPGYNPYRTKDGKFGSGPHAAKVAKAQERVAAHADKVTAAKQAKRAAVADARAKLKIAKAADAKAKKNPTPENKKAARSAATEARRAARLVDKHETAINRHTAKHAEAKQKLSDAKAEARAAKAGKPAKDMTPRKGRAGATAQGKPPDKSQPASPEPPKREPLSPNAKLAAEAMARGDMEQARRHFESHLDSLGLSKNWNEAGTVSVRPDAEMPAANGYHGWDGHITIRQGVHDAAKEFASAISRDGHKSPAADLAEWKRLEKRSSELWSQIFKTPKSRRAQVQDEFNKTEEARVQAYKRSGEWFKADGARTLMHETLHGYQPGAHSAYSGHGIHIEEITTEVSARHAMHDMFGVKLTEHDRGSYSGPIKQATAAIAEVTGHPVERAYEHLAAASFEYKRRESRSLDTPEGVRRAFAQDIARVVGSDSSRVEAALIKHFTPIGPHGEAASTP